MFNKHGPELSLSRLSSIFLRRIVGSSLTTSAGVKPHVLRVGRRSRLSKAKESAEAAVALSPRFSMSTLRARSVVTASRRCLHQTSLRSPADHDDSCELPPPREAGRP